MDSDETLTIQSQFSSSVQLMDDVSLEDIMSCEGGGGYDDDHSLTMMQNHQQHQKYMSSRLSSCSSLISNNGQVIDQGSSGGNPDCFDQVGYTSMSSLHSMSRLSIESFDGGDEADEELSEDNNNKEKGGKQYLMGFSSESDHEEVISYSLPATPPRKRATVPRTQQRLLLAAKKDYGSETDAQKSSAFDGGRKTRYCRKPKSRRSSRKNSIVDDSMANAASVAHMNLSGNNSSYYCQSGGESEGSGLMVITKPKGGSRSICMDIEEVKACRELGFELEHERMLEMPSRLSISVSNLDTSSGGNSPIAPWPISSPGDDPRDVKARLKVWAQAVAISSTSKTSF